MEAATRIRKPLFVSGIVASAATALLLAAGGGTAHAAGCKNANLLPQNQEQATLAEAATRCLINRERKRRGLRSVRFSKSLQKSSDWQAEDMLAHRYFDHERDGGPGFVGRITRFGYAAGSNGYALGENIAWSTCEGASPKQIVKMWMDSPPHRANILQRKFKEQAISALYSPGNVGGDYDSNVPFVIFVNQFGARY